MEFDYTFISTLVRELTGKVNAFSPSTLDVHLNIAIVIVRECDKEEG